MRSLEIPQIEKLTGYVRAEVKPWLLFFCVKEKKMLAREATKADIQAVYDRLREAKEQRQLDIQINQAIALVNRNHRRKKYDTERLSAGSSSHCPKRFTA